MLFSGLANLDLKSFEMLVEAPEISSLCICSDLASGILQNLAIALMGLKINKFLLMNNSLSISFRNLNLKTDVSGSSSFFLANSSVVDISDSVIELNSSNSKNGILLNSNASITGSTLRITGFGGEHFGLLYSVNKNNNAVV